MNIKGKTLLKNGFLFKEKFFTDNDFAASLKLLIDKWNPTYRNQQSLGYCWSYKEYKEVRKRNKIAYDRRVNFINSLNGETFLEFEDDIYKFLEKYDLGKEWINTITDFILCLWLYPPPFNLHSDADKRAGGHQRVILELNPDTSPDDLAEAWGYIKKQQKELYPLFKRKYFTKKSFTNLDIAIMDIREHLRAVEEEINPNTGKLRKYKRKDTDIVGKIWESEEDVSESTDQRRAGNLRQIRRRFKQKTA